VNPNEIISNPEECILYVNAEPSLINKEGVESRGGMPKKI
jgi:hypothetical protein